MLFATICAAVIVGGTGFVTSPRKEFPDKVGFKKPQYWHQESHRTARGLGGLGSTTVPREYGSVSPAKNIGDVVLLLPLSGAETTKSKFGTKSPVDCPSLRTAAIHFIDKIHWFSDGFVNVKVMHVPGDDIKESPVMTELVEADALLALGLMTEGDLQFAENVFENRRNRDMSQRKRQCHFALHCARVLPSMVGRYDDVSPPLQASVIPWSEAATGMRMKDQMIGLFDRWTSDDMAVALMLFFNQFSGTKIDWVKHSIDATWEKGPIQNAHEFFSMATKCGDCIVKCLTDESCKACIDALNTVDTRDQVASYRTIVSFESELLKDFSFCILQRNNVFNCDSKIPELPKVSPISTWRGKKLTKAIARSILAAHLADEPIAPEGSQQLEGSWKVAAGANVAYDQFPSQTQLFYEAVNKRHMWYDPIFRVATIDGRNVWCKRHYKVRDGKVPGTFRLSVLDNGVISNEFWTIGGVADDLSWIVFHYSGAASKVGQRYIGGLVCTPDGALPPPEKEAEIWEALERVRIQPWELYVVDNDPNNPGAIAAGPPPTTYYRDDVLKARSELAK